MKILAKNKKHLQRIIKQEMIKHGNECDLNHIDVSFVEDMSDVFRGSSFNGNISNWNVSNVKNLEKMFAYSKFNGQLNDWTPINAEFIVEIFTKCPSSIPYWATIKNLQDRNCAIAAYHQKQQLEKLLDRNDTNNTTLILKI